MNTYLVTLRASFAKADKTLLVAVRADNPAHAVKRALVVEKHSPSLTQTEEGGYLDLWAECTYYLESVEHVTDPQTLTKWVKIWDFT